jgi:ferredoxin-nitrite reductase
MWVAAGKAADLGPEEARLVRAEGRDLALVRTADGLFAMDNTCPHSGGSLAEGLVQGQTITCPLHGWQFQCKTGRVLTEKRPNQRVYKVKLDGGQIWVELPDPAEVSTPDVGATPAESEWIAVAEAIAMEPGSVRKVQAGAATLALVCTDEGVFALDNSCVHEGGPLGEGSVEGTTVTCPLHAWKFEAKTGRCLTNARRRQRTYETRIDQGQVWVRAAPPARAEAVPADPSQKKSPVEVWKQAKHGIDVWPDVQRHARDKTPMSKIEEAELERMKWYGYFYRKNNDLDHYMCRVRIPGCEMTSPQARALAYVAYESGYSIVDLTTRGNVQIQGLKIDRLPAVRAALERVDLTSRQSGHDNVRNVTSHPWSGIDPEELIDTRALARQIQDLVIGDRELSDLPRKVNVALTGRPDAAAHFWTQDIAYVAAVGPDESVGFQLLLGGNQGQSPKLSWHIPVFVRPEDVVPVTGAILRTFRELGWRHNRHQVRLRYLIDRIGADGALLEIQKRLGHELAPLPKPVAKPSKEENFVGWFAQKQEGLWALGVCVPLGRLTAEEMEGLAVVAGQYGSGVLRTTYDQNLVIPGIRTAAKEEAAYAVARHGLTFEPDPATRNMVACTGKQFCNIAVTETKGYAYQLIEELRRRRVQLHGINIHMSGCPSSCAMTYTADIGLKGVKVRRGLRVLDAFDLYLGGGVGDTVRMGTLFRKGVPFGELPGVIEDLAREFYLRRSSGETFSRFWTERLVGHKAEPLEGERPRWRCTRCRHVHVAEDPPRFCPICAAIRSRFEPAPEGETEPEHPAAAPRVTESEAAPAEAAPGARVKPAGRRILVVGGSIGGHIAAQTARELAPDARITLVTDEHHSFYNRLNLTRLMAEEIERRELFDYGPAWYEEHQIEILTATRVIGLDPLHKAALLAEGRELAYDACILTHGCTAAVPPFFREGLRGVFFLRTLEDVESILALTRAGTRAAVIGGGVLGLEAAHGLKKRGASVQVFEFLPRLMPRQLDDAAASLFIEMVREKGIEAFVGISVAELRGAETVTGLALADGRSFDADLVVVSTGIRPNVDWVRRAGIQCNRGVLVDDRMQTSAPDVYAAGDVVEWRGQVVGLWTSAIEQAKVATANAIGGMAVFHGFVPVTILKCLGIPLVSLGEVLEDGAGITSSVTTGPGTYRRVVFRHGIPVGGVLLGSSRGMGELRKLIEGGVELERLRRKVVPDEVMAHA